MRVCHHRVWSEESVCECVTTVCGVRRVFVRVCHHRVWSEESVCEGVSPPCVE